MLDPILFRKSIVDTSKRLSTRRFTLEMTHFQQCEEQRKQLQTQTQHLQSQRNQLAKKIGIAKSKGEDDQTLLEESQRNNHLLASCEKELSALTTQIDHLMAHIPNIPHESTPIGNNEHDNCQIRCWQTPQNFSFPVRDHIDLGELHQGIQTELASKISGARFIVLRQKFARLHEALARFMLDIHVSQHNYEEVYTPYLVNASTLYGTGQLPKFADDLFHLPDDAFYLIPTAEVTLANLIRERIVESSNLPMKWVARTPCFRREAGSYGKDIRGMIRQHQFDKVELVWAVNPCESYEALETLVSHAEAVLQALELPYRVVQLCTGDLGFAAAKTYDLEVWLPSQNTYREISSCSNCEAFQARRMMARFRNNTGKNEYLHTLNGSGVAVGRAFIAVLENYQQENGNIRIPKVLQPYFYGQTLIEV